MGIDIYGWVEVREDNSWWAGVINIDYIAPRHYSIFNKMFGAGYSEVEGKYTPIAAGRGLPKDHSTQVKERMYSKHDGELIHRGVTWVGWDEIKDKIDYIITGENIKYTDWNLLFNLMGLLAESYGEKNTRLVVGFLG